MRAAPAIPPPPVFAGHLHLVAAVDGAGRTVLAAQSFRAPFHIGKGYWDDQVLQVRIVNPTAGILEGDQLELAVEAGPGAALLVTTPAATRAFMMKSGIATCRQRFAVAAGGWLEYAPEPLFPHGASDYRQSTVLSVESGGELYYVDALAPGRVGRGEIWAWRRLRIGLEAVQDGIPLLREHLDCSGEEMRRLAAFHGAGEAWFGTVVMVSPRLQPEDALWDRIRGLHQPGCRVAPTRLCGSAWMVRIIAGSSLQLRDTLEALRAICAQTMPRLSSDLRRI